MELQAQFPFEIHVYEYEPMEYPLLRTAAVSE